MNSDHFVFVMSAVTSLAFQSCVVPLYKLLVREKRDERDSHGIYVISQNRKEPEMYELVCRTREDRDKWMKILQEAIKKCPEEGQEGLSSFCFFGCFLSFDTALNELFQRMGSKQKKSFFKQASVSC